MTFFGPDSKTLTLEMFSLNRLPTPEADEDVGWDRFLKASRICNYTCEFGSGGGLVFSGPAIRPPVPDSNVGAGPPDSVV